MALRWTAAESTSFGFPFLALNQAANWNEFRAALSHFSGPGINVIYADRAGNVGHQVAGTLPFRKGFLGDLPMDGTSGSYEWEGNVPFELLPSYYNPASGRVVSANQNPFRDDTPYSVSGFFAAPYRQRQIDARLSSRGDWTPQAMLGIQTDVYSAFSAFLARAAVDAVDRKKAEAGPLKEAVPLLRKWGGLMDKDAAAPAIAELLYRQVRRRLGESAANKAGTGYRFETAPAAIEILLRERPAGWFADWDEMLVDALREAIEDGRRQFGGTPARWRYGRMNTLRVGHPVFGGVQALGSLFSIGPVEMSGNGTTVKQTTTRLGPSMRFIADLSDWDKSLISLPGGQSGHLASGHYKDLWEDYYSGSARPLQFNTVQASATLAIRPEQQ